MRKTGLKNYLSNTLKKAGLLIKSRFLAPCPFNSISKNGMFILVILAQISLL